MIVQLSLIQAPVKHQPKIARANRRHLAPWVAPIPLAKRRFFTICLAIHNWNQIAPIAPIGNRNIAEPTQCGIPIDRFDNRITCRARGATRIAQYKRNAMNRIVNPKILVKQPMITRKIPVIRAIQYHGILQLPHLIQIIQNPTNLGINRRNQRVITRQTALQAIGIGIGQWIPTPIGQTLLHKLGLAGKTPLKIINRTIGQHHLIGIVHIKMLCRRCDWCMGPLKTHVQKKRARIVPLLQKCQRFVSRIMLNRMSIWQFGRRTAIHRIFLPGSGRAFFVKIR